MSIKDILDKEVSKKLFDKKENKKLIPLSKKQVKNISTLTSIENDIDKMPFLERKYPIPKEIITNIKLTLPKEELILDDSLDIQKEKTINIPTAIDTDIQKDKIDIISDKNKSELISVLEVLHSPNNIEGNTILTNPQVIALSVINYLSQVYDIEFFKHFIQLFPRYRISGDDGRGRKELIEIANAIRRDKQEETNKFLEVLGRR